MPKDKKTAINYTSREFSTIRKDLEEYARRYYPESYKDFNQSSFGSLMLDTVSYIGDVLSFYLDYNVNESFLDTATEYRNVMRHGRNLGYKPHADSSTAYGPVTLYCLVPARSNGLGPDTNYLPTLLEGSTFKGNGMSWILRENVDFSLSTNEIIAARMHPETGVPTYYAVKAHGQVMAGMYKTTTANIGAYSRFKTVPITDKHLQEIISVTDSDGHQYYEVDYLSQNVVYKAFTNPSADGLSPKSILKPMTVPRRFIVQKDNKGRNFLQFGYGSESETNDQSVADPTDVVVKLHGRTHITDAAFDPSKLLKTDKFGISPSNTMLTIAYRSTPNASTGVQVGGINKNGKLRIQFTNPTGLNVAEMRDVRSSIEVYNEDPITGGGGRAQMSVRELKMKIYDVYAAQNRCVTQQDYEAMVYNMPDKFGSIARCRIIRDDDSFKRNLNLYVISRHPNGGMTTTNDVIKENLKVWLNKNKMINDTIDILDAKVVNLGVEYKVKADTDIPTTEILRTCSAAIRKNMLSMDFHIGESLKISEIYSILNRIDGVIDVIDVKIVKKVGNAYSDIRFNVDKNMTADRRYISCPQNVIFEVKYPRKDIKGTVV
jgi:hypothetical protein